MIRTMMERAQWPLADSAGFSGQLQRDWRELGLSLPRRLCVRSMAGEATGGCIGNNGLHNLWESGSISRDFQDSLVALRRSISFNCLQTLSTTL